MVEEERKKKNIRRDFLKNLVKRKIFSLSDVPSAIKEFVKKNDTIRDKSF